MVHGDDALTFATRKDRPRRRCVRPIILRVVFCVAILAQTPAPAPVPVPLAAPSDLLGRSTPRGAVFGFLSAARKEDHEASVQYLNTRLRGQEAESLALQLSAFLDRRLPANLNRLSDQPEGSGDDPNDPDMASGASFAIRPRTSFPVHGRDQRRLWFAGTLVRRC